MNHNDAVIAYPESKRSHLNELILGLYQVCCYCVSFYFRIISGKRESMSKHKSNHGLTRYSVGVLDLHDTKKKAWV